MLLTTTHNVEGHKIAEYYGVVSAEAVMGANVIRDFVAGITDIIGGRSGVYEGKLHQAKEVVLAELIEEARKLGANAVVGINVDFEELRGTMLMIVATGTAVKIEPISSK